MRALFRSWETSPIVRRLLWIGGALLALGVGVANRGHLALDEFFEGVVIVFPAQAQPSLAKVAWAGWYHPPLGRAIRGIAPRIASFVGIDDPMLQLRFSYGLLGLLGFLVCAYFLPRCFRRADDALRERKQLWVLFLSGFYFLSPLLLSRPMEESLSLPFVAATLFYLCRYASDGRRSDLLVAAVLSALAAHVRFQLGLLWFIAAGCAVLIPARRRDLLPLGAVSVLLFLAGGFTELVFAGRFYGVLRDNLEYNRTTGAKHGRQAFYVFLVLTVAATLPPTLFARYRGLDWKREYRELYPVVAFFALFLLAHTAVSHKEDRFLIPALPAIFLLLSPLLAHLVEIESKKRIVSFVGLNLLLLVVVCLCVPQRPVFALADYLRSAPEAPKQLVGYGDSLGMFPNNLLRTPVARVDLTSEQREAELFATPVRCDSGLVVRRDILPATPRFQERFEFVATFDPNPVEQLLIKANPRRNGRRDSLLLFREKSCPLAAGTHAPTGG